MLETPDNIILLAFLFLIVATGYASVGLGGGSSYSALLAIFGLSTVALPMISLSLNLAVTAIGSWHFIHRGHARTSLILPFLITSMPMAYLGGALAIPPQLFHWLLLISLIFVAVRIFLWREVSLRLNLGRRGRLVLSLVSGGVLGLVAGIVGIGGGIFLIPLILILGLGTVKEAAASGSVFVGLNSLTGLISRYQHNEIDLVPYWPLLVAVIVGGVVGSNLGSGRLPAQAMQRILGVIVLVAIVFLARRVGAV